MKKIIEWSYFLIIAGVLISTQSCKSTKTNTNSNYKLGELGHMDPNRTPDISGTWILKSLNGQKAQDIFKAKIPTLTVDFSNNRINGNGGCNNYSGAFTMSGGVFSAGRVAATMMMCVHENQESQFFAMLEKPNTVSIINDVLTFKNEDKTVAEFIQAIDQTMLQGKWVLDYMDDSDLNSLFAVGKGAPTLEFDSEEGRLRGNAGCNSYGAPYQIEGTTITVGGIMSTRMACPNMEGEGKFTRMISEESTIKASADELTFSKDGKVTLRFKKEE